MFDYYLKLNRFKQKQKIFQYFIKWLLIEFDVSMNANDRLVFFAPLHVFTRSMENTFINLVLSTADCNDCNHICRHMSKTKNTHFLNRLQNKCAIETHHSIHSQTHRQSNNQTFYSIYTSVIGIDN